MNIIVMSDLNWLPHMRSITKEEAIRLNEESLHILRYERIKRYFDIIIKEEAELVIFAGDVTGDGSCGHGFQHSFAALLLLLERRGISTLYIPGNHDMPAYYPALQMYDSLLQNSFDISNQSMTIRGMKILGISYADSKSKRKLKQILSNANEKYDMVIAHSQLKRRIRLFDLDADYIFTGHYDRKLFAYKDSIFTSFDNDTEEVSYAVVRKQGQIPDAIQYKVVDKNGITFSIKEQQQDLHQNKRNTTVYVDDIPSIDIRLVEASPMRNLVDDTRDLTFWKYLRGLAYKQCMMTMHSIKDDDSTQAIAKANQIIGVQITANYKISESLVEDYLGNII